MDHLRQWWAQLRQLRCRSQKHTFEGYWTTRGIKRFAQQLIRPTQFEGRQCPDTKWSLLLFFMDLGPYRYRWRKIMERHLWGNLTVLMKWPQNSLQLTLQKLYIMLHLIPKTWVSPFQRCNVAWTYFFKKPVTTMEEASRSITYTSLRSKKARVFLWFSFPSFIVTNKL